RDREQVGEVPPTPLDAAADPVLGEEYAGRGHARDTHEEDAQSPTCVQRWTSDEQRSPRHDRERGEQTGNGAGWADGERHRVSGSGGDQSDEGCDAAP